MMTWKDTISGTRKAEMGMASFLIVLAHSVAVIDYPSNLIIRLLSYLTCGNYIFAFLSGYGLFHSMSRLQEWGVF